MDEEPKELNYINREYQLKLLESVKKMNTILYIPTGSGKTYITTMLIKAKGETLTKSLGEGRKWTFFIIHNEFFIGEQVGHLRNHLPWNIGVISSNMNVDSWSREQWDTILEKCHIIVITDRIYLNNLQHGFMNMMDANLIIFDDCHYAASSHPYKEILQIFHGMSFENTDRPHILGFTATLINQNTKNVKEELIKLQQTFNTTIITKYLEDVQTFLAYPEELIYLYDEFNLDQELIEVMNRIKTFINFDVIYEILDNNKIVEENENNFNFEKHNPLSEIVKNIFCELQRILVDGGAYITYIATWHFIVEIEKHKKQNKNGKIPAYFMLSAALSELTIIRKMLYDYIITNSPIVESPTSMFNNTSPKLKELMTILSRLEPNENCLVYVNHQTAAKLLYHYIKLYIHVNKQENIACDFITETEKIFMAESKEIIYKKQLNNETIKKFNKQVINILITSDQLENCIDFINCKYVIMYDTPTFFSSYIQSKDRARNNGSKFAILMSNLVESESKRVYSEYIKMEEEMNKILVQCTTVDNYNSKEEYVEEVFKTEFAITTLENAIAVINRYCRSLPQDNFTNLCPEWYIVENCNNHTKYKLMLPINSVISTPIDGKFYKCKMNAKKSAALNACIVLYNAKALDDYMMPIKNINKLVFTDSYWFPYWEDIEAKKYKKELGSKQIMRSVHIETPSYLFQAYPQVEEPSYLYVIHCVPNYCQINDPNDEIFDQLLKSNKEFGILTSKKLPSIAEFPIFLHFGDVLVHIKETADIIFLDQEQYKKLDKFHTKLFIDILKVKEFVVRNYENEDNSYLIVPVYYSDDTYSVDWEVVDINNFVESEEFPTMEQRKSKHYEPYLNKHNIISPWYRNIFPIQQYVVTNVYSDMTPQSPFSSSEFNSYEDYFNDKYNINVAVKDQPLIKAKPLNATKINYSVPITIHTKKSQRQAKFIEILIPEFCIWHNFPSDYWFKSLMLPTILYRCNQLLLAEELLVKFNSECNIKIFRDSNINDTLEVDRFSGFNNVKKKNLILPLSVTLSYLNNSQLNNYEEFNTKNFPIDIDKKYTIKLMDIYNYHEFMIPINHSKSNHVEKENILKNVLTELNILNLSTGEPPILSPLYSQYSNKTIGPKQSDILKVMTSSFSGDIFNNERLNIFGDSFLRFAISLVLLDTYQSENEGFLIELRMKISGLQNLFFVGKNKNLGSYLMVNAFEPIIDWMAPGFSIPLVLKKKIEANTSHADVIYNIVIPKDEQYSGNLSDDTLVYIDSEIKALNVYANVDKSDNDNDDNDKTNAVDDECLQLGYSFNNLHINKQSVADKTVVNCVKSIIGIYGYYCGVKGFNILCCLGIIPKEFIGAYDKPTLNISDESIPTLNYSHILPGYEILEQRINYSFKNKLLLVQALTHPSYQFEHSGCYQRLQFLGDAILDFLITSYVFEYCNDKIIKDIKDIIYSLVNNIIYASLSIRIGLHRFILAKSVEITEAIDRFYKYQQRNNHTIGQDVLFLIEENDCETAEFIDVPKVLSDLFKSLIGAIYLDCDKDLKFVWTIFYRFLENEIKEFCTHIPKNPICILSETQLKPKFSNPVDSSRDSGIIISLSITLNNKNITVRGCGKNKKAAKLAAAKIALRYLKKEVS